MTPDLVYDQMIAAGCARKLVFSYLGNPGVGPLHCVRRAVEKGIPTPIELEEYSHFGMVGRYTAGAARLPFFPLRSYLGADMADANPNIRFLESPYGEDRVAVVPALNPDVAILHAQRADFSGNTQFWGLLGVQKEVGVCCPARHRRGGRDRGRVGDPPGSEPNPDPQPGGGRRRAPAPRRTPLLCPGVV